MNLRLKGEKVISRLLGRRKKSSVQLAGKFYPSSGQHNPFMYGNLDRENDGTTTAAPKIVVQDESSKGRSCHDLLGYFTNMRASY